MDAETNGSSLPRLHLTAASTRPAHAVSAAAIDGGHAQQQQQQQHIDDDDDDNDDDQCAVDRFCYQYLQLESRLDYPGGHVLKQPHVQHDIFERLFADSSPGKSSRFQLRALKELVRRVESSISDDEADDYEVSDCLIGRLGELVATPLKPEAHEAQRKSLVSYRLALLHPAVTIGILENRALISAGGTTGLRTWEAALHLGQFLCLNRDLVAGRRVLELGAGTGYLSILCAQSLGAAHVTASDGSEEVVDNLADNFALNGLGWSHSASSGSCVSPKLLKWGHALLGTEEPEWNGGQKIELIIGADITYDRKVIPSLLETMRELLELHPEADIIISATQRNQDTLAAFVDAAPRYRLAVVGEMEFSPDQHHRRLVASGQSRPPLTPFYDTRTPIRIFRVSNRA